MTDQMKDTSSSSSNNVIKLTRFKQDDTGTLGFMSIPGLDKLIYTIENPWLDNKKSVSCIPTGTYPIVKDKFYRGGYESLEIENVPDRSQIKVHIANTSKDIEGCIGPGLSYGRSEAGDLMVYSSRIAHFQHVIPAAYELVPTDIEIKEVLNVRNIEKYADIEQLAKDKKLQDFLDSFG